MRGRFHQPGIVVLYLCTTERCSLAERRKHITKEYYAAVATKRTREIPDHGLYRFSVELCCVLDVTQAIDAL